MKIIFCLITILICYNDNNFAAELDNNFNQIVSKLYLESGHAKSSTNLQDQDCTYSSKIAFSLKVERTFDKITPFVVMSWGKLFTEKTAHRSFSFNLLLGGEYHFDDKNDLELSIDRDREKLVSHYSTYDEDTVYYALEGKYKRLLYHHDKKAIKGVIGGGLVSEDEFLTPKTRRGENYLLGTEMKFITNHNIDEFETILFYKKSIYRTNGKTQKIDSINLLLGKKI